MQRRLQPLRAHSPLLLALAAAGCACGVRTRAAPAPISATTTSAADSVPAHESFVVPSTALGEARSLELDALAAALR